jgi:tetratricopeptide (TPR) repeat protein
MSERLAQLTKLYEVDPSDPFVTYGIAMEHAKLGRPDQVIHWLDKTLELDRNYCYAYYQKAKALSETGDEPAAVAVLKEGIDVAVKTGEQKAASEMNDLLESMQ